MNFSPYKLGQYLLLSDPGFVRLRLAIRALLTTGLVCAALALVHPWLTMSAASYSIAMITALQGAVAIKETTAAARAVTRIYSAIAGFSAIALLALIDHSLLLVDALLLVVIFLAVYARRFSVRWQAVGMFAFMCTVVGAFLKPHEIDLRSIALAFILSGIIAHLVRNYVLPERPDIDCRRIMKAAGLLIDRLSKAIVIQTGSSWSASGKRQVTELERKARDAILLCESYLPLTPSGTFADEHAAFLAMRLFDLQLAMESALTTALGPDEVHSDLSSVLPEKLEILARAKESVNSAMAATQAESFANAGASSKKISLFPRHGEWLSDRGVRQAFQVTIASAIAMVAGLALSPERWFWAVLTAFLIFSNTHSRGDLYVRALNRAFGTAVGILIGIGLATLVGGELYLTIILAAISIFAAFYLGSLSYSVMTFFITIAIALIYGLIGVFTPALLVLRLEETMIGVAAGIFVSLFVLPLSTAAQAREAIQSFIQALDQFLDAISASKGGAEHTSLVASIHLLDTAQTNVVAAILPMQSTWTFGLAQERPRRALIRISMLVHQAHILAREFADRPPNASEAAQLGVIREQLAGLAEGNYDMFGRSVIADMAKQPAEETATIISKPADNALDVMAHVLRQADVRNQQ